MEPSSFSVDIRRSLAVLSHWGWLLFTGAVLASGAAYLISAHQQPVYEATTLVSVEAPAVSALDYNAVLASERLAPTYAERMATRPVLESVILKTGAGLDVTALQAAVKVQPVRDTRLIRVSVQATDPGLAALLANTLVAEFSAADRERQAKRFDTSPVSQEAQPAAIVVQEEPAAPPTRPVKPRILFNTLLAGGFGLLLAAGIVFLFETLDDSLRHPQEDLRSLDLPILGFIPHQDRNEIEPTAALQPPAVIPPPAGCLPPTVCLPHSPAAEAFRTLRTNLGFAGVDPPPRSLLVSSPTPMDGKSSVAANLAAILAEAECRVILVDADLRRPTQHKLFGLQSEPGLSDLFLKFRLAGGEGLDLEPYLQPAGTPFLKLLPAGSPPHNPAELLGSEHMLAILDRLLIEAEVLIFDSPPVLAVTDAAVLATRLDGVLLVVKPGETKLAACRQAVEQLRWVGANLLGAVVNGGSARGSYVGYYRSPAFSIPGGTGSRGARWKALLAGWLPGRTTGWVRKRRGPAPK